MNIHQMMKLLTWKCIYTQFYTSKGSKALELFNKRLTSPSISGVGDKKDFSPGIHVLKLTCKQCL